VLLMVRVVMKQEEEDLLVVAHGRPACFSVVVCVCMYVCVCVYVMG
jgi:hypothetical protein